MDVVKQYVKIGRGDVVVEPSAGGGAFIDAIKKLCHNYRFYDIEPAHDEVVQADYLTLNLIDLCVNFKKVHVIGNPPFGRQASLARKFIRQSCIYADTIAFILPRSFKKKSMQSAFSLQFHLVAEMELPPNSFLIGDTEHDVPCIFQVWSKHDESREVPKKERAVNFVFVKKEDNPHVAVRRVGVNAGNVSVDIASKSSSSHYFIRFVNDRRVVDNLARISDMIFEHGNTTGPKSISKGELVKIMDPLLV